MCAMIRELGTGRPRLHVIGRAGLILGAFHFFFFQAEDGIRDLTVTGSSDVCSSDLCPNICTCAIPIIRRLITWTTAFNLVAGSVRSKPGWSGAHLAGKELPPVSEIISGWQNSRSEERRVGKE